jgi:hypothetical protein
MPLRTPGPHCADAAPASAKQAAAINIDVELFIVRSPGNMPKNSVPGFFRLAAARAKPALQLANQSTYSGRDIPP